MYVCMYVYVCMYLFMYVRIFIYAFKCLIYVCYHLRLHIINDITFIKIRWTMWLFYHICSWNFPCFKIRDRNDYRFFHLFLRIFDIKLGIKIFNTIDAITASNSAGGIWNPVYIMYKCN